MKKPLFDEEYTKLLKCGTRQELFKYRNAIIDELNRRGENKNPYVTEKEELGTIAKVGRIVRRGEIFFLELIAALAIADIIRCIILFAEGKANQTIVIALIIDIAIDIAIAVVGIIQAAAHKRLLNSSKSAEDALSTLAMQAKVEEHPLGRKLMDEPLELLKQKKQQIDEKLGL